ncbi:MAG: hypothetical protein C7B45_01110 [Sulfobacillus acidophilus]|uniref:Uncharacterized protein n=1 Tax=Sulfobacillus acidophilus TaxID=53633 RepID=A0A2T2WNV4_9FIRM|nr:MAG: hypothetical protein C7B45_01110 [Sulfobacillus acidophilus]
MMHMYSTKAWTAGLVLISGLWLTAAARVPLNATSPSVLLVNGDTVSANEGCIVTGQYPRGTMIVFRAEVRTENGTLAPPTDKVSVHLSDGKTLPMIDIPHPFPGKPMYWVATWVIPMNAKLGTMTYTITATDSTNGEHGIFYPFPTPNSLPTIVPYTYTPTVSVTAAGKSTPFVKTDTWLTINAPIDLSVPEGKKTVEVPLTQGQVSAELGSAGVTTSSGTPKAITTVALHFDRVTKSWDGNLQVPSKTPPGAYEIEVTGHDAYGNVVDSTPVYLAVDE